MPFSLCSYVFHLCSFLTSFLLFSEAFYLQYLLNCSLISRSHHLFKPLYLIICCTGFVCTVSRKMPFLFIYSSLASSFISWGILFQSSEFDLCASRQESMSLNQMSKFLFFFFFCFLYWVLVFLFLFISSLHLPFVQFLALDTRSFWLMLLPITIGPGAPA